MINDCVWVFNNPLVTPEFVNEWLRVNITSFDDMPSEIACPEGRSHNVKALTQNSKVFYVATREIAPGEELCVYYGPRYWRNMAMRRMTGAVENEKYVRVNV
jgi:hypothetical protein